MLVHGAVDSVLQNWRQKVLRRALGPRVSNVSSPVTGRLDEELSRRLEFDSRRVVVCRCARVLMLVG